MSKRSACALYLAVLIQPALAGAQEGTPPPVPDAVQPAAAAPQDPEPAQIVIEGRRPGPGLWKVSKDGHVMWVFGLYSPLPRKMEWDAGRVERLVAQSQEVLQAPQTNVGTSSVFGMIAALPAMIGMKKSPDGARLEQVVPADVYGRWTALKGKYLGDDDGVEQYRPLFAADELMNAALERNGLVRSGEVRKQIEKIAKKHDVKLTWTGVRVEIDSPGRALRDFKKSQVEDVACFTKTVERFEGDIDAMRARANAWAEGKIAAIRNLDYAERDDACNNAVLTGSFAKTNPALQNMPERRQASWVKAAETALGANKVTFAMLSMNEILGPKSYLAVLQEKGYAVESPK
ncbi:TraB/GumN family protein [uncultured Massilia sp.]|uniref:TraB/GumN family protein n=1 Tax=uncultured Massilia sp. TaxID=169973 RepID=UPI0025D0DBA9|nr:TraB/GumN family protein [uncultured Massilia sp.]